jgi:hypothetical protein
MQTLSLQHENLNSGGKGTGEITELPLFECTTQTANCTVASIEAKNLPWPTHLESLWGNNYLIVEKVDVEVVYGGSLCAYAGIPVIVSGSAGGIVENSAETATFDNSTIVATGTGLWVGFSWVEWNGVFPTEAFALHREQGFRSASCVAYGLKRTRLIGGRSPSEVCGLRRL